MNNAPAYLTRRPVLSDSRPYVIEYRDKAGNWLPEARATGTAQADSILAHKRRFRSGQFRAVPA